MPCPYTFNARPKASSTDSPTISDSVGCGHTVRISSASVLSSVLAMTKP